MRTQEVGFAGKLAPKRGANSRLSSLSSSEVGRNTLLPATAARSARETEKPKRHGEQATCATPAFGVAHMPSQSCRFGQAVRRGERQPPPWRVFALHDVASRRTARGSSAGRPGDESLARGGRGWHSWCRSGDVEQRTSAKAVEINIERWLSVQVGTPVSAAQQRRGVKSTKASLLPGGQVVHPAAPPRGPATA